MFPTAITRGYRGLLDWLAPLRCPLCRARLDEQGACRACGFPNPDLRRRQLRLDRCGPFLLLAGGDYQGPLRRLIHAWKYRADPGAGVLLLAQTRLALPASRAWDALVPVPTPWARIRVRGGEPVAELAARLGRLERLPVRRALRRTRSTPPLAGRGSLARRRLVAGAFRARDAAGRLLVIDDVATTGATFRACRRALLEGGAASVDLLVAGATPRRLF